MAKHSSRLDRAPGRVQCQEPIFPEANKTPPIGLGSQPMLTEQPCLLSSPWFSCVSNTASTALLCFEWVNKSSILFKIKSKLKFWLKYCSLLMLQPGSYRQSEFMPTALWVSPGRWLCPCPLPFVSPTDGELQGCTAARAGGAFVAAGSGAGIHGAGLVQILTNATALQKCIYILSVLFTHMFNKSLFII